MNPQSKTLDYDSVIAPIRHRMVNAIWRLVRDADDTEDVLHNAFEKILKHPNRIANHPNPTAAILRICIHCAIDFIRRSSRHRKAMGRFAETEAGRSNVIAPNRCLELRERQALTLVALRSLPKRQAEVITLHALEGLSYEEVAHAMECSEGSVRVTIHKARKHLRSIVENAEMGQQPVHKEVNGL